MYIKFDVFAITYYKDRLRCLEVTQGHRQHTDSIKRIRLSIWLQ